MCYEQYGEGMTVGHGQRESEDECRWHGSSYGGVEMSWRRVELEQLHVELLEHGGELLARDRSLHGDTPASLTRSRRCCAA
jgi:hypothetical protein